MDNEIGTTFESRRETEWALQCSMKGSKNVKTRQSCGVESQRDHSRLAVQGAGILAMNKMGVASLSCLSSSLALKMDNYNVQKTPQADWKGILYGSGIYRK